MKKLVIIGARGFGREVYHLAKESIGYNSEYVIKGFLDDKFNALIGYSSYPPILSSVESYKVENDDVFICALGEGKSRKRYVEIITEKGGDFINIIHPSSIINSNPKIGIGLIIAANCYVSCDILINNYVVLHVGTTLGHDVKIGNYCSLGAYSFMGGGAEIEDFVTLHPKASILPHIKVSNCSIVGVNSVVMKNVPEKVTVFGNPAKIIF